VVGEAALVPLVGEAALVPLVGEAAPVWDVAAGLPCPVPVPESPQATMIGTSSASSRNSAKFRLQTILSPLLS
jgi:hypothetical protein